MHYSCVTVCRPRCRYRLCVNAAQWDDLTGNDLAAGGNPFTLDAE
jgi:hypothetical protein